MKVLVATIETELYAGSAISVVTETLDGELKVFPGHAPLLAVLRPGLLRIYCPADKKYPKGRQDMMLISGGYLEVQPDKVTVLADAYERIGDIDAAKAKRVVDQARETYRLAAPTEAEKALLELEIAVVRLKLSRRNQGRG